MTDFQRYINKLVAEEKTSILQGMICDTYYNNPECQGCPMGKLKDCRPNSEEVKDFFYKHTVPYEDLTKTVNTTVDELKETYISKVNS